MYSFHENMGTTLKAKKKTYEPILRRVPAQDIREMVGIGLNGARYHFDQIRAAMMAPGIRTGWSKKSVTDDDQLARLQSDVNRFHWHLRAFFWELYAEMDLLHVVVQQSPKDIRKKNTQDWQRAKNSRWFSEISAYRNFAHESFLFVQALYKEKLSGGDLELDLMHLLPAIKGQSANYDLLAQLSDNCRWHNCRTIVGLFIQDGDAVNDTTGLISFASLTCVQEAKALLEKSNSAVPGANKKYLPGQRLRDRHAIVAPGQRAYPELPARSVSGRDSQVETKARDWAWIIHL